VISHSFVFNASRHLSILVSMLDLSPPLPVFLQLRVGGLSRLNTRAIPCLLGHVLDLRSGLRGGKVGRRITKRIIAVVAVPRDGRKGDAMYLRACYSPYTHYSPELSYWTGPDALRVQLRATRSRRVDCR
jgi:hypothetical protein